MPLVSTMVNDLLHLFFPNCCLTCYTPLVKGETWICTVCLYELPQTDSHQVPDNVVAQKFYGRIPISYALAFYQFRKENKVQKILHELKYAKKAVLGEMLGKKYGYILRETYVRSAIDLIIPVPLHITKLQQRGYNQSDYFAQGLAASLTIPWSNQYFQRVKKTDTQTKKDKLARLRNVEEAFSIVTPQALYGKHLLLVDDVITTGATLEACALALLANGVQAISVATIAVAE
jgi:ComF family protein